MALQSTNLVLMGLGIQGDAPFTADQPPLVDGVHLRWSVPRERAFPWYGFTLYRRPSKPDPDEVCLAPSVETRGLPTGATALPLADGRLWSPVPLLFTDEFATAGMREIDLSGRPWVRFDRPAPMHRIRVSIGFRQRPAPLICVRFDQIGEDSLALPTTLRGVTLAGAAGRLPVVKSPAGLTIEQPLEVQLPERVVRVLVDVTGSGSPIRIDAADAAGRRVARRDLPGTLGKIEAVELAADRIASLRIAARNSRPLLLSRLCYEARDGSPRTLRVEGLDRLPGTGSEDAVVVASADVSGSPGDIVSIVLAADRMTGVRVAGGDAVIVDVCWSDVASRAQLDWEPLKGCPAPFSLPVRHPDYPAARGPVDLAAAEVAALDLIRYGAAADWAGSRFEAMHTACLGLVEGGPAGGEMSAPARGGGPMAAEGPADVRAPALERPHPLDAVLIATLHPPIAEMIGLAFTDESAELAIPYDYMVVADHVGAPEVDPEKLLKRIEADGFPNGVDAWITFGHSVRPQPPLVAPRQPIVHALPGGILGDNQGRTGRIAGGAGLRWDEAVGAAGWLDPGSPVMHHVYRSAAGRADAPLIPQEADGWATRDRPVIRTRPKAAPAAPRAPAPNWPPHRLQYVEMQLPENWFVYQIVAVDVFGRFSPKSPYAAWRQWAPEPVPRPWYYAGTNTDAEVHPQAVRILDKARPPVPVGVEAFVLDPADPIVVKDAAYQTWRTSLGAAGAGVIGLRVRWRWTAEQQARASDTTEFRLYWSPGSPPPPGWNEPEAWPTRFFVSPLAANARVEPDGTRVYEVFLPAPGGGVFADGVPLEVTPADPIGYANVTVTAADAATHTPDRWPGAGPLAGRVGNESPSAPPAKVFRVRREKPGPPSPIADRVPAWATPADWHGRSRFTFRWRPEPNVKALLWRALDEAIFEVDWAQQPRPRIRAMDPAFPQGASIRRQKEVAAHINAVGALLPRDASPEQKKAMKPAALALYRALSDDALRVLANRTGNERAFVQVTVLALDGAGAPDLRGPDDPAEYQPDPGLGAFVDEVDGRATNRLLYRASFVDAVHNRGPLGPCGTVVRLPDVTPPRTPTITRALGGDRSVKLAWASNREADLAEYRVYRADNERDAASLAAMTLRGTVAAEPDPAARPATVEWSEAVPGLRDLWYRVVAVDRVDPNPRGGGGNVSAPSAAVRTRAFDNTPPVPPPITTAEWVRVDDGGNVFPYADPNPDLGTAIRLAWPDAGEGVRLMVQAKPASSDAFSGASAWLAPGTTGLVLPFDRAFEGVDLRLRVTSAAGNVNVIFTPITVAPPV